MWRISWGSVRAKRSTVPSKQTGILKISFCYLYSLDFRWISMDICWIIIIPNYNLLDICKESNYLKYPSQPRIFLVWWLGSDAFSHSGCIHRTIRPTVQYYTSPLIDLSLFVFGPSITVTKTMLSDEICMHLSCMQSAQIVIMIAI